MSSSSSFAEALARHQSGDLAGAERLYARILAAEPRHADSLHLLGVIAYQRGRLDEAASLIARAIEIDARAASYHANLGLVRQCQGRLHEAASCQRLALGLMPDYPEAHNNLGLVLEEQGEFAAAADSYRAALALNPGLPEAHNNLGNVLEELGLLEEAASHCRTALSLRPDYPKGQNSLGIILARQGQMEAAIACYRQAIAGDPDYGDAYNNLGHALKASGRFDDAAAAYRSALASGGDAAIARHGLSGCRKFSSGADPLIAEMAAALEAPALSDKGRSLLNFGLGKIFDDLKDYARAIAHFDRGNRLERKRQHFDGAGFAAEIDRLIAAFPQAPAPAASTSERPLLIVGLPRSGTTLVEQILASHPSVAAGGELNFWLQRSHAIRSGAEPHYNPATERQVIDDYLSLLAAIAPNTARVTDKMPYNFLAIGLVHRLFPKARIVHCRRDPLDTALSIYLNRFARGQEFAYDRGDILLYVQGYLRLMAHWRKIMPSEQFCEIDYEELVEDQRAVTRKLLDFCGLSWDEACMAFFRTERPIDTLSAWQARQPLYQGSVARWRHYRLWLGVLVELRAEQIANG